MLPTIRTLIHESLQQSYKGSHNEVFKGEMGEGGCACVELVHLMQ